MANDWRILAVCNLCGDKYLAGTLGDLKNPSATTLGAEVGDKSQQESGIVSDGGPEQAVGTSLPETSDTALQLGSREDAEMTTNPIADQPNIGLFKEQGIASQPIGASIAAGRGTSEPFHGIDETSFPRPDSQDTTKEVALRSGPLTELKADS